jgi:hypothetical protein
MRTASIIISLMMMEAVCSSETSVYLKPTWRSISEGYNLHIFSHAFEVRIDFLNITETGVGFKGLTTS